MQMQTPVSHSAPKHIAAPLPFPLPNSRISGLPAFWAAISGSNTRSTSHPPRKYPTGMVKNWNEFRAANTRHCMLSGIVRR